MQHQDALRVIRRLGPELTKQSAEAVLLRHAESEDLAPAQLEKLAQAYNMVRQLTHIDAAEDRGSTCHQIDTPALVRSYVGGDTSKAAAVTVSRMEPTHDASVDLMLALRRELSPVVKAAAEMTLEKTHPSTPAPSPEADILWHPTQLKEAAWDAKVSFYMIADEVLKMAHCEGRYLQVAEAEKDAMRMAHPVCVSETLNWLSKYAGQQKLSRLLTRHEGPVKAAAFQLTSPLADKIVELTQAFTLTSLFHKFATAAGVKMEDMDNTPASDKVNELGQDQADLDVVHALLRKQVGDVPATTSGPIGGGDQTQQLRESGERINKAEADAKPKKTDGGGKDGGTTSAVGASPKTDGKHWLASLISGATKPVGVLADAAHSAGESAKGAVTALTSKPRTHRDQESLDKDVADIRRSILIRRLAANDPVLRDMPLKHVLETYNAIAESNPEVAANPRRVLLAMREAASYEGVTLDAQKMLGDVRSTAAKTSDQEATNANRKYSV